MAYTPSSSSDASSPLSAVPMSTVIPANSRSFVKPFPLGEKTKSLAATLAESVKYDQDFSGQSILLAAKALAESKNWSMVAISSESWAKVFELRSQVMRESDDVSPSRLSFFHLITPGPLLSCGLPLVSQPRWQVGQATGR
jgi:hypothetical protein